MRAYVGLASAVGTTPLGVLDLVPVSSRANPGKTLRNSVDLARACEYFGYARYWVAHPSAMVLALTAAATSKIRIGMGHGGAMSLAEEFGLIAAPHRGRFDLGLGWSGARPPSGGLVPAGAEVWIHGSGGDECAQVAGLNGLPFAASYHASPATVLAATDAYRAAFRPSAYLDRPYVSVIADVVVAPSAAEARDLAGVQLAGAEFAGAEFAGSAAQVADRLEQLRDATCADELIITTITREHADRVRSYHLLAAEWRRR